VCGQRDTSWPPRVVSPVRQQHPQSSADMVATAQQEMLYSNGHDKIPLLIDVAFRGLGIKRLDRHRVFKKLF